VRGCNRRREGGIDIEERGGDRDDIEGRKGWMREGWKQKGWVDGGRDGEGRGGKKD